MKYVVEPGGFQIIVGSSSQDADLTKLTLTVMKSKLYSLPYRAGVMLCAPPHTIAAAHIGWTEQHKISEICGESG